MTGRVPSFSAIALASFALSAAARTAVGATERALPEAAPARRIERLVAGGDRLFALRGGEIVTYDAEGRSIARCARFTTPPRAARRPELGAPDVEEVLRVAGLPDTDDSTPEAEDALADEGLEPRPARRAPPETSFEPRALAAGPTDEAAFVATSSGVFRAGETGCGPAGLDGRDLLLVAANERWIVTASDGLLFRAGREPSEPESEGDLGGPAFAIAGGLASRPRALAIGADGAAVVGDDDGILEVAVDGTAARVLERPADALAVCDGVAMALATDGVYAWTPGNPPARISDRPPARALACGPGGAARWVATGVGAWTSADGRAWLERTELLGRSVSGAAAMGDRLWLAADDDLVALDAAEPGAAPAAPPGARRPAESLGRLPTRAAPIPVWPLVTVGAGIETTEVRRIWTVMLLVTFPLGRAGGRRSDPTLLAGELVRRDETLAREQFDLRQAAGDDDEVDARLAVAQQEREALR